MRIASGLLEWPIEWPIKSSLFVLEVWTQKACNQPKNNNDPSQSDRLKMTCFCSMLSAQLSARS